MAVNSNTGMVFSTRAERYPRHATSEELLSAANPKDEEMLDAWLEVGDNDIQATDEIVKQPQTRNIYFWKSGFKKT
jgi:hypothetical protein